MKDKLVLGNRKCMRRKVIPGTYGARNDDDLLLLVSIDVSKDDLLDDSVRARTSPEVKNAVSSGAAASDQTNG